jgi:hypothetical protein
MRKRFVLQPELGTTAIEEIIIPTKSRDELPPVLMALQYIFVTEELSEQVFALLEQRIELKKMGRSGLSLWEILVLGVVRLTLDANYDRLDHIANYDSLVRELLGVKDEFGKEKKQYSLTSLKENIRYIDEFFLIEVNELIVKAGHSLLKKKMGPKPKRK